MLRSFEMLSSKISAGTILSADPLRTVFATASGRYDMPWHWHDCLMLLMPRAGAINLRSEGRLEGTWVSEDRFAVIPAGHPHQTEALRDTHAHLAFYITEGALGQIERESGSLARIWLRTVSPTIFATTPEIRSLLNLSNQMSMSGHFAALRHVSAALLLSCLSQIEQTEPLPSATVGGHGSALVRELCIFISDRPSEEISLDTLADHFGVSRRHMTRMFRDRTGASISEYHLRMRLQFAERLLTETDSSIGEIAFRVGFESSSALSRAMRRAFGHSPSDVRDDEARTIKF